MGVATEKLNVHMIRKGWRINGAAKRLLRKWLKMNKMSEAEAPVPAGCFPVYVGEGDQKERFVVTTEHANHPMFKSLLEDAESEYGFCSQGPLSLPCHPDFFFKVLAEMEYSQHDHCSCSDTDEGDDLFPSSNTPGGCNTPKNWWFPFRITTNTSPKVRWPTTKSDDAEKQCRRASPYRLLTPPNSLLKMSPHGRPS